MPQYSDKRAAKLAPVVFERTHTKVEIREAAGEGDYDWAFATPQPDAKLIKWKNDATPAAAIPRLQKTAELLEKNDFSGIDVTKSAIWDYADETGRGEVLWPLRVALTGRERSPDPFTCLYVLGKEESLARIGNAITALEKA